MSDQQSLETDADKLRRRNRELTILNTIAKALNQSVDLGEALFTALAQVAELLDLQTVGFGCCTSAANPWKKLPCLMPFSARPFWINLRQEKMTSISAPSMTSTEPP